VNVADTPANRAMFGCTGTAEQDGEGAAPFPQVRIVALTARAGRAVLGAILGRARAGEQTLLARLVRRRPDLFAGRVTCFDRNFPGYALITTLLDHQAAPADAVRETYLTRWSASETTFGEDKATITGAGDRTSGPVLRSGSPRLVISEAWAWLTATQLVRASAAAALRSQAAAARALRRRSHALVTADEESFTAVWRDTIRSMTPSQVTA